MSNYAVRQAIFGSAILLLSACSTNHLIFVQEATMGVSLNMGVDGMEKFSLGYDRDIFAIVPSMEEGDDENDAMSTIAINKAQITSMTNMHMSEFIAAGAPASKLATESEILTELRKKIYGKEAQP